MSESILYFLYLISWKNSHKGKGFKGCKPVCRDEWRICELLDMQVHPDWYNHAPFIGWLVENTKKKRSRTCQR